MNGGLDAPFASGWIDGNWMDIGSFVVAFSYALIKSLRRAASGGGRLASLVSKATAVDIANGTSIFPLLLLGFTFASSKILEVLLTANKLILSVATFLMESMQGLSYGGARNTHAIAEFRFGKTIPGQELEIGDVLLELNVDLF